jgi:hypothetical protein
MEPLTVLILLVIFILVLYLINAYLPIESPSVRRIINIVAVIAIIIWLLKVFNVI